MAKKSKKDDISPFIIHEFKSPELKLNDKKADALNILLKDEYFQDRLGNSCKDILKAYNQGKKSK